MKQNTPLETAKAEARQNWHFFQKSAESHKKTLDDYNALLWDKMEWESLAHDLVRLMDPGCEGSSVPLKRYADISAGGLSSVWMKAREVNHPGRWYWARLSGCDDYVDTCPQVVFITLDDDGISAPDWRVLFIGEDEKTAKNLSYFDSRGWEFSLIPFPK